MTDRTARITDLHRGRIRDTFLRRSLIALAALTAYAWSWSFLSGELDLLSAFSDRNLTNIDRFLGELVPYPLQGKDWDWGVAFDWAARLTREPGWEALTRTFHISVVAICLAGIVGAVLALPAARTVARPDPYLRDPRRATRPARLAWGAVVFVTRGLFVFLRAVPEYVWAFLLVRMLGVTAWPAVIALALHNAGIVGRLQAEVIENVPPARPAALRGLGASRRQIALFALIPETLNRFLLFFFYRWETCVREATVLGLLGMISLGAVINEARAGQRQDEMFFFVLLGAALVVVGDLISVVARAAVRRAS